MTCCVHSLAALAAVAATLASLPLGAAPQPADVPTYQGVKPAEKPLPREVPSYRLQPATPRLIRRGMNAPRPGVAIPGPCRVPKPQTTTSRMGKKVPATQPATGKSGTRG